MNLTVGEFKKMLEAYDDGDELSFSGLDFYRLKRRGDDLVQVEFNEHVYKDSKTGKVVID
ncbi:hypothetical protein Q8G38_00665 [Halomonas venusta]|uniref:hypothetical protein n=1 Tax=Vreelandella venusta TaxID=44935 RepID=UPI00295F0FB5|nr:hypothetical protein [Halomonas venusta]MDW0357821.1 hypothetical protein [Halomonas venusta]